VSLRLVGMPIVRREFGARALTWQSYLWVSIERALHLTTLYTVCPIGGIHLCVHASMPPRDLCRMASRH
jgi:hypothetical protein